MTPRPGDIVFVRGNGFMSRAIRQITGGHYNHVEIYVGGGEAVGAMEGQGVRKAHLLDYTQAGEEFCFGRMMNVSDEAAQAIANRAASMQGSGYDTTGLVGIWFKFACKWAGIRWIVFWGKNKAGDQTKFWCSEMVALLYLALGYKLTKDDPSWATPTEIYESDGMVHYGEADEQS